MKLDKAIEFPKEFLWGTAACAHQVEGDNTNNDWWAWEQKPDTIKNRDKSGKACNHYELYETDFKLLADLGTNAHRLGIEWSRIVPEEGTVNRDAIDHYKHVLECARNMGLDIHATTHHFSSPTWFTKKGGFINESNLDYFKRYIEIIARELSPYLNCWNTINEPAVYAVMGWMAGESPPGHQDVGEAMDVLRNIILAHAIAYNGLKEHSPNDVQVGIVKNIPHFIPANPEDRLDVQMAASQDKFFNEYHLNGIETGVLSLGRDEEVPSLKGTTDFYGLNYYMEMVCDHDRPMGPVTARRGEKTTQMGWGVHPEGLHAGLIRLKKYGRPIYITENGIATDDDAWRVEYITQHLEQVRRAMDDGADVRGYFYWSSLDNFEWAQGWEPHFGLISFDRETFERKVKPSGEFYGECARAGAVTPEIVAKYTEG